LSVVIDCKLLTFQSNLCLPIPLVHLNHTCHDTSICSSLKWFLLLFFSFILPESVIPSDWLKINKLFTETVMILKEIASDSIFCCKQSLALNEICFVRSMFVLFYVFFWSLCCLFFLDLRFLITPLVSSNSSYFHNLLHTKFSTLFFLIQ
jgi:hypothetical protein